jgi:dihydropteroate synthase
LIIKGEFTITWRQNINRHLSRKIIVIDVGGAMVDPRLLAMLIATAHISCCVVFGRKQPQSASSNERI